MKGDAPEACNPEVMTAIVTQHLESPSMWVVFPIQVRSLLLPCYLPSVFPSIVLAVIPSPLSTADDGRTLTSLSRQDEFTRNSLLRLLWGGVRVQELELEESKV